MTEPNTRRRIHCGLCHEVGHNYRTCGQVEILHEDWLKRFKRIIIEENILILEEGFRLECPWLSQYTIVTYRAMARKLHFELTLSKTEYVNIFHHFYFDLAFHQIQTFIGQQILRDLIREFVRLESSGISSMDIQWSNHPNPVAVFPIELRQHDKTEWTLPFDCPVCYECIEKHDNTIRLNCGHLFCESCMFMYLQTVKTSIENLDHFEICVPKCALCRKTITVLQGNVDKLQRNLSKCDLVF
jgi:hypothetical protein